MKRDNTIEAFFALVRAGLWEKDFQLPEYGEIDYDLLLQLAEEQSVMGLVAAGFDHVKNGNPPKEIVLQFVGQALQLEQQNQSMNSFVASLVEKMRKSDIYSLLLKGQGIAQCYERPLWRSCGDVDLFLSEDNYKKAKKYLLPLASTVELEGAYEKHLGMTIDSWVVELHGTLRSGLSKKIDKGLDLVRKNVFYGGEVRSWNNGNTQVFIPSADNDAIYIFTHILQHFFKGGIGLRQVCDWCRLLYTYKDSLNHGLLESRIRKMGLISEWRAFGTFAVNYLGMPIEAMPLFDENDNQNEKLKRKAKRICSFILEVGNFGQNRDMSYYGSKPYIMQKVISLKRRVGDLIRHARIFPMDSIRFFPRMMFNGVISAIRGE